MKSKRYMYLDTEQHSTLLRCLVEFKNDLVRQGRTADIVDEVILLRLRILNLSGTA